MKRCPNCKTDIHKNEGCNRVYCVSCQTHICWKCLKAFNIPNNCYDHLVKECGGIFDPVWKMIKTQNINEILYLNIIWIFLRNGHSNIGFCPFDPIYTFSSLLSNKSCSYTYPSHSRFNSLDFSQSGANFSQGKLPRSKVTWIILSTYLCVSQLIIEYWLRLSGGVIISTLVSVTYS